MRVSMMDKCLIAYHATLGLHQVTSPSRCRCASRPGPTNRRVLLFDVMDTLVRDPFFTTVPGFFGMTMKELFAVKHPTAWANFERGQTGQEDLFQNFFIDGRPIDGPAMLQSMVDAYEWIDGMEQLLQDLQLAGVELHAMSNYPVWYKHVNNKLGLDRYLQWTFVSCEGHMRGLRKPDQACFHIAMDVTGVADPSQLVLIDDRQPNVTAAAACGLEAVLFRDCEQLRGQLQQLHVL